MLKVVLVVLEQMMKLLVVNMINLILFFYINLLFITNNGVNIEKHFDYKCKLMETEMNDFIFILQYGPLNIDSIYLNQKMSKEIEFI